ncbi:VanZ family protein [Aureibaculum sp. 2210JD6-5]|uniref:VanZ family protein n=1 Tax=Aureibaculum sp. 2210JD6-5 TaxID=3103957 RepID=UPI002AACC528|nr:VanZ family protein [Aureibaculum sp. 2210JD6-5]MDY7394585.1 VanZ family protein [Aureibaculum sp. 2210JD6-5]
MLKPIKRLLERNALIIAIFLTLFVAFLSLVSLKGIAQINIGISNSDKIGHLIAYFTLSMSWFYVFRNSKKKWVYIALSLVVFGMILEALQGTLTTYRTADWYDELANTSGVLLAWLASHLWFKKQEN